MKKLLIVSILFFAVSGYLCLQKRVGLEQERRWFNGLYTSWNLFEADYTEDIKNIDALRDDLEWRKGISLEWERLAMEFKHEALDWKMKYNGLYTAANLETTNDGNHLKFVKK